LRFGLPFLSLALFEVASFPFNTSPTRKRGEGPLHGERTLALQYVFETEAALVVPAAFSSLTRRASVEPQRAAYTQFDA